MWQTNSWFMIQVLSNGYVDDVDWSESSEEGQQGSYSPATAVMLNSGIPQFQSTAKVDGQFDSPITPTPSQLSKTTPLYGSLPISPQGNLKIKICTTSGCWPWRTQALGMGLVSRLDKCSVQVVVVSANHGLEITCADWLVGSLPSVVVFVIKVAFFPPVIPPSKIFFFGVLESIVSIQINRFVARALPSNPRVFASVTSHQPFIDVYRIHFRLTRGYKKFFLIAGFIIDNTRERINIGGKKVDNDLTISWKEA